MKSIGVSQDLPEYLKSKYSVSNPTKKPVSAHKAYKPTLLHGVSEESPKHFKLSYVPVLNNSMKNSEISSETGCSRFVSDFKQNLAKNKPRFEYSEIKSQKFDYDTLKFVEGIDVKGGNSARIQRAMAYTDQYSKTLGFGFGLPRGDFNVELAQPNVPRSDVSKVTRLCQYLNFSFKKEKFSKPRKCERMKMISSFEIPRQVNTPSERLRKRKIRREKIVSLADLDRFDADFKSKQTVWKPTSIYSDY